MPSKTSTRVSNPTIGRSSFSVSYTDENQQVPKWFTSAVLLSMVGSAIGLRKPYNFHAINLEGVNGPLRDLISYITLVTPLTFLEISIGQFTSRGSVSIWDFNSLFKGLGYTLVVMSILMAYNHSGWNAIVLDYIISIEFGVYPWANCDLIKNKCLCIPGNKAITAVNCTIKTYNYTNVKMPDASRLFKTENYESERISWSFLGCSFLLWLITYMIISKLSHALDKVISIFSILYVFAIIAFIIRVVTHDNFTKGTELYFNVTSPFEVGVEKWREALSIESFCLCSGVLVTYTRFNEFKSNTVVQTIAMVLPNLALSIAFSVFMYIGFAEYSMTPDKFIEPEIPLRFQTTLDIMAMAMERLASHHVLWVKMYLITQLCAGFVGNLVIIETIMYNLQEEYPTRWEVKPHISRLCVCVCGFLIGTPFAINDGASIIEQHRYHAALPFLVIAFFQVVCFVWVYGVGNFSEDILLMIGGHRVASILFKVYFKWCLVLVTPGVLLAAIILFFINYFVCIQEKADRKGFIWISLILIWFPVYYIVVLLKEIIKRRNTDSLCTIFCKINKPSVLWGPQLDVNRTILRYQRLFTLSNPIGQDEEEKNETRRQILPTPEDNTPTVRSQQSDGEVSSSTSDSSFVSTL